MKISSYCNVRTSKPGRLLQNVFGPRCETEKVSSWQQTSILFPSCGDVKPSSRRNFIELHVDHPAKKPVSNSNF